MFQQFEVGIVRIRQNSGCFANQAMTPIPTHQLMTASMELGFVEEV
jgi:hypothetical protein